jgi:hypothetical protein
MLLKLALAFLVSSVWLFLVATKLHEIYRNKQSAAN